MTSLSRRIAWNTFAQVIGKVATTTLGVIITILLTRYLGPAGFGTFTFVLVFVAMFGTIADWGLTLITVREASRNSPAAHEIIGNVLVIRFFLAAFAALVAVGVIALSDYDPQTKILVGIASLTLLSLSLKTSFQIIFNVKLRMEKTAVSDFSANLATIVIVTTVIYFNLGLVGVIIAYLIGDLFAATIAAFLGFRLLPLRLSLIRPETKYLVWESLPMGAILVVFTIYNRVDTVLLARLQGTEAVGLYGAAYRVYEVLTLGAAYFANAIMPLISNLAQTDKPKLLLVYRRAFVILLILGLSVAGTTYALAPLGIAIIAGPEFAGSVEALRLLSFALIAAYFNHLNGYTLIALGKQWYSFVFAVGALALNITLNWFFIPYYSYRAAALITFITEAAIVLATLMALRHLIGLKLELKDLILVPKEAWQKRGRIFDS